MKIDEQQLDKAIYMACNEAILRSTVGIATNQNRGIGTGSLVSYLGKRFILTAEHVMAGVDPLQCRFFIPPPAPLREHSMLDGIPGEFGPPTPGDVLQVGSPLLDHINDVAAFPLASTFLIPSYMNFFRIEQGVEAINDGASIIVLGFPVDNSATFGAVVPGHLFKALGLTSSQATYSDSDQDRYVLHSSFDRDQHFIVEYSGLDERIGPHGFSGAGAWCVRVSESPVWRTEPLLAGVITGRYKSTAAHPHLLQATRFAVVRHLFESDS